jgi:hypothetical protein
MTPELRELLEVLCVAGGAVLLVFIATRLLEVLWSGLRGRVRHAQRRRFYKRELIVCTRRAAELNAAGEFHTIEYADIGKRLERAMKFFAQGPGDPH